MHKLLLFCSFFLFCFGAFAQEETNEQKALDLAMRAVYKMEASEFDEAIELLKKAKALDKKNIDYAYEMAYAYYSKQAYKQAIKQLNRIKRKKASNDQVYQLLGNAYDMADKPEKAIKTYRAGLKKYPASGKLYLEQANVVVARNGDVETAIRLWEKGIEVEPGFASNYYWLAKTYAQSEETVWSVMYGELFVNLERNSPRTIEMSELLFRTYSNSILYRSELPWEVKFTNAKAATDPADTANSKVPFAKNFSNFMLISAPREKDTKYETMSIATLHAMREGFIRSWYRTKQHDKQPNILFDYLKTLDDIGYLEAYDYWFFMKGQEDEFAAWYTLNEPRFESFIDWYGKNPLEVKSTNAFIRTKQ